MKLIYGVGINDCDGRTKYKAKNGTALDKRIYSLWYSMLMRAYSEKYIRQHPTYRNVSVCERWLRLSNFAEDIQYLPNYELWRDNPGQRICLDKDIRVKGNKLYSPETCMFVTLSDSGRDAATRNPAFIDPVCSKLRQEKAFDSRRKEVICTYPDGTEKTFPSMGEVEREEGIYKAYVSRCCLGKIKSYRGFKFRFAS